MFDKSVKETAALLKTDIDNGLTAAEAAERLETYGRNQLPKKKKRGIVRKFFSQFGDLMIIILLIAAAISFGMALYNGDKADLTEPVIIVAIVLANAVLGTVQENRAEKSLDALEKITSPKTKVVRGGEVTLADSAELVPGDLCIFEAGDIITADCRLTKSESLAVNESALSGESLPADKNASKRLDSETPLPERSNCVFSGCFVTAGRCRAVVFASGKNTEIGKIAGLLKDSETVKTPLQNKLRQLSKVIGIVCLAVCALVMIVGFVKGVKSMKPGESLTEVFMNIFMTSVSLAVAAIPEGLPAVVTVVLARGIERMVARNAIVKTLPAVEALGSASVICTDKTGTLTQNKMTVTSVFDGTVVSNSTSFGPSAKEALAFFSLCCDAVANADGEYFGDPTEIAVVYAAQKQGARIIGERLYEIPFDSERKMMTVVVKTSDGYFAVTKGGFDVMAARADNADKFTRQCSVYSHKGLRVLALSVKKIQHNFIKSAALENKLHLTALIAMYDPPRDEARQAVATCLAAGIRPVMITGDNIDTAREIARELGIMSDSDIAVDGTTLLQWTDKRLEEEIGHIAVFARVTPSDKLRIVNAWKRKGEVVAMTGDGVNDAPALKAADIGCAMGKSGTEVAKDSADMILTDDNFATIVEAVSEGRGVYDNIKKAVKYLLSCNIGEVLSVFIALVIWNVTPLCAMQLLWVNLVTDGLPGLALGMEKREKDIMLRSPKRADETFFSGGQGLGIALYGVMFAVLTLIAYALGNMLDAASAGTMAFIVLAMSQLFFALEVRTRQSLFKTGISPFMAISFAVSAALVVLVTFVPSLAALFSLSTLPAAMYAAAFALSAAPVAVVEAGYLLRLARRSTSRRKKSARQAFKSSFSLDKKTGK